MFDEGMEKLVVLFEVMIFIDDDYVMFDCVLGDFIECVVIFGSWIDSYICWLGVCYEG